jgi:hypothetical protein
LTPGGSSTVHIHTQTIHRIQRTEHTLKKKFGEYTHSFKMAYLLTYSMEHSPSWEANQSLQLVKNFPTF